jgi:hypothetical protein
MLGAVPAAECHPIPRYEHEPSRHCGGLRPLQRPARALPNETTPVRRYDGRNLERTDVAHPPVTIRQLHRVSRVAAGSWCRGRLVLTSTASGVRARERRKEGDLTVPYARREFRNAVGAGAEVQEPAALDEEPTGLGEGEGDREVRGPDRLRLGPRSPRPPSPEAEVDETADIESSGRSWSYSCPSLTRGRDDEARHSSIVMTTI